MKTTTEHKLEHGRIVNGKQKPLYLRIEVEDGNVVRATLGIEMKDGKVSWQLALHPSAFAWASRLVTGTIRTPDIQ